MVLLKKKYIPNYISVFRLLLIPLFLYFYFSQRNIGRAVVTFLVAGASDVCDCECDRLAGRISCEA